MAMDPPCPAHRATLPPRRAAAALALAALAAAGCAQQRTDACPGRIIARLALRGTLASAACEVDPPGGFSAPATYPEDPSPGTGPAPTIEATFAWDEGTQEVVFCNGHRLATPLRGPRDGDHVRLTAELAGGAVLAACGAQCAPATTLTLDGNLTGTADGGATGFQGSLTETLHDAPPAKDGSDACAPCALPCHAIYTLGVAGQEGG